MVSIPTHDICRFTDEYNSEIYRENLSNNANQEV